MSDDEPKQRRLRRWIIVALSLLGVATVVIWVVAILTDALYFRDMDEQERAIEEEQRRRA